MLLVDGKGIVTVIITMIRHSLYILFKSAASSEMTFTGQIVYN